MGDVKHLDGQTIYYLCWRGDGEVNEGGCKQPRYKEQDQGGGLMPWLAGDVASACSKVGVTWLPSRSRTASI